MDKNICTRPGELDAEPKDERNRLQWWFIYTKTHTSSPWPEATQTWGKVLPAYSQRFPWFPLLPAVARAGFLEQRQRILLRLLRVSRLRGCISSSVRFCGTERKASGSVGEVLQLVLEPQAQQSLRFPAGAQLSLKLLLSDWGMEWPQPRLPKPALPLPLVVPFSRVALCAAGHLLRFCALVRLLRQLFTLLRDEEREVSPWQSFDEHIQVENEEPKKCSTSVSISEGQTETHEDLLEPASVSYCLQPGEGAGIYSHESMHTPDLGLGEVEEGDLVRAGVAAACCFPTPTRCASGSVLGIHSGWLAKYYRKY
ncbi:uncharacterized protein LOC105733705 [Aotus nancymaae]|uniref:uncharacterized protein LOC105733705 n=1 Tax=Aotus nancymaae TaxID=37293 RepID=UPI0030FE3B37